MRRRIALTGRQLEELAKLEQAINLHMNRFEGLLQGYALSQNYDKVINAQWGEDSDGAFMAFDDELPQPTKME